MDVTATHAALKDLRRIVSRLDDVVCHLDSPPMGQHTSIDEVIDLLDHARRVEQDFERLRREELEELEAGDRIEDLRQIDELRNKLPNPKTRTTKTPC